MYKHAYVKMHNMHIMSKCICQNVYVKYKRNMYMLNINVTITSVYWIVILKAEKILSKKT